MNSVNLDLFGPNILESRFSQKTKIDARDAADGKCIYCGVTTAPGQKSQKGVTPPTNEGQTDHYDPRSKGGSSDPENANHACRACNNEKSNTSPRGTKWELPKMKNN